MTIFEAKPLKSAVKSRAKQYEDLKGQVETLKKEFQGIVDLDEELAGSGATAIKNFYRAQVEVAHAWIELFTTQISFLKGIPAILEDADLSGETVVEVPFLEGEVTHGLSNAKSMVNQQSNDLQKIFQTIDDILPLTVFKQEDFHEKMEKAQKEKNDTIKKVHEVDNKLVEEYQVTEAQESVAISLFQALLEATSQDGTVSPMNFNQSAFQASQAYQVKDEVAENMQGYRDFKKQEEEARKLEQEMEELENRPWYEKAWDTTKTFTGEITGYYDSVRATTGVDPVTGRKLSEAERIAAGAMAAAGFIPIVGWAGRAIKGGSTVYKTVKGLNAADHALDAYKSSKGLDVLKQTEYGLYGLTTANGLGEAVAGKDMFGNELTEEQRQNSLMNALGIAGVAGAAKYVDKQKFMPNEGAKSKEKDIELHRGKYSDRLDKLHDKYGKLTPEQLNQRINLRSETKNELERLKQIYNGSPNFGRDKMGPALAGVYDKKTGKYYYSINTFDGAVPDLVPILQDRLDNMPKEVFDSYSQLSKGAGSHAEVLAVNEALKMNPNARIEDLTVNVIRTGINKNKPGGLMFKCCPHCSYILDGFEVISEANKVGR